MTEKHHRNHQQLYRRQHEYIHIRFINDPIRFIRTVPVNGESLGYQVIEIERDRYRHQQDEQLSRNENRMGDYFQIFLIGGIDDDFGFFRFNFDIVSYFPTTDLFPFLQIQQEGKMLVTIYTFSPSSQKRKKNIGAACRMLPITFW